MGVAATDRNRNLFLKGFRLSNSGANEDPTYLGFKFVFDFGTLPINPDYGWAPSPLLRIKNYTTIDGGAMGSSLSNPFGQPQYEQRGSNVIYYSAMNYLLQRDSAFIGSQTTGGENARKRAAALRQFQILLNDLNTNTPWFFQSIDGLDELEKIQKSGFQPSGEEDSFNIQRTAGKVLTINCLESLNLRLTALADLYNQATFDADNMRWLVPRNLRKFTMWIFVTEIRNFFKTSRLTGVSTALASLDNISSVLTQNLNPGSSIVATEAGDYSVGGLNISGGGNLSGSDSPGGRFKSFVNTVFDQSGLANDVQAFRNQSDQSGIKPVLIYECSQCEFDFSSSTPLKTSVDMGSSIADPETQSFKIYVGKVRMKNQYPNIRQDGKPLILSDGFDQYRSSLQIYDDTLNLETIRGFTSNLITNFTSQAVNDLVNEGINQFVNPLLSGINQSLLGNIYSFNPTQLGRLTNQGGQFGFNNAQNFLNGAAETGIDNVFKGNLPNPQSMGLGGPGEGGSGRVYPPVSPPNDVYGNVPGSDLGVPDRVYPPTEGDVYPGVPGSDLGVPDRVYPPSVGDVYPGVPGQDLGVPDRVYPPSVGDVYPGVPGQDLGVPDRVYPPTEGDVYPGVPGSDLGVPDRVYPSTEGDVYPGVPGQDLGVPDRIYPSTEGDVYPGVPGQDLGVPDRIYPSTEGDVYPGVPGQDLGVPGRGYSDGGLGDVYSSVPGQDLGVPDRAYRDNLNENVYPDDNISNELGRSTVYSEEPLINSGGELRRPENSFSQNPGRVYDPVNLRNDPGNLGKIYPITNGDFILEPPLNLGNSKPPDKYNPSLGTLNPRDFEEEI
jgi:hypothetical protein